MYISFGLKLCRSEREFLLIKSTECATDIHKNMCVCVAFAYFEEKNFFTLLKIRKREGELRRLKPLPDSETRHDLKTQAQNF